MEAACRTLLGELFGTKDGDARRPLVHRFVEIIMICRSTGDLPANLAAEIFPFVPFWNFEDVGVYSEILAAHSAVTANERGIINGEALDREVQAFEGI